jgi:hypothetical protein
MLDKLGKIVGGSPLYNLLREALKAQPLLSNYYIGAIKNFLQQQTKAPQNTIQQARIAQALKVIEILESTKQPIHEARTTLPDCLRTYLPTHQQQKNTNGYSPQQSKESTPYISEYCSPTKPAIGG